MEKMTKINKKANIFIKIVVAILIPFFIEILKFKRISFDKSCIIRMSFIYFIYAIIALYKILKKNKEKVRKIVDFIIKYRYIIATVILVIGVLLKVNFSSTGIWSTYVNEPNTNNVIIGKARGIRSDEWVTQSAFMLGQTQGEDAYKIYNNNIAQGTFNMLMFMKPIKDITIIAKPLLWGFILFGQEYGFSFYWMLKMVALIMVSIELVRKITEKDNILSLVGGIILSLAPAIMWWFSSAIVDAYIYGLATILLFGYYMNNLEIKLWKKIVTAIGIFISITAFALVLYPAIQVPFAFFMIIFMLIDFIPNIKKLSKKDYLIIAITIIGVIGLLTRYILLCYEDIKIMMSTVYPGKRIITGGGYTIDKFISYLANIFFPYTDSISNVCEPSSYIYPFIGLIILLIYNIGNIKKKEKNKIILVTISLSILYIIYLLWEFVGFGEFVSKITLLSLSTTDRIHVVTGFIGTLLTILMIKRMSGKNIFTKKQSITISLIVVIFEYVLIKNSSYADFFTFVKLEIISVMMFTITYLLITGNKNAFCYSMLIVSIIAGATVNPIAIGLSPIKGTEISYAIQEIKKEDEQALWIGNTNITGQYLIANGVNCLNGVNEYPNFKFLNKVDPDRKFDEVYNRFAHISVALGDELNFELLAGDAYVVTLTHQNIKDLEIEYIYSNQKYNEDIISNFNLETRYCNDETGQYIYQVK